MESRTDSPSYHQSPDFDYVEPTQEHINKREQSFWTNATPEEMRIIFLCAFDEIMDSKELCANFITELSVGVSKGNFVELREAAKPYIEEDVTANNDGWII